MRSVGVVFMPRSIAAWASATGANGGCSSGSSLRRLRWNRSTFPVVVGLRGLVSRCLMPFSRHIRSSITSPPPALKRAVNCLPVSVSNSSGMPYPRSAGSDQGRPPAPARTALDLHPSADASGESSQINASTSGAVCVGEDKDRLDRCVSPFRPCSSYQASHRWTPAGRYRRSGQGSAVESLGPRAPGRPADRDGQRAGWYGPSHGAGHRAVGRRLMPARVTAVVRRRPEG